MWIKDESETTSELYIEGLTEEPLEFSSTGAVQVDKETGEKLVELTDLTEMEDE